MRRRMPVELLRLRIEGQLLAEVNLGRIRQLVVGQMLGKPIERFRGVCALQPALGFTQCDGRAHSIADVA